MASTFITRKFHVDDEDVNASCLKELLDSTYRFGITEARYGGGYYVAVLPYDMFSTVLEYATDGGDDHLFIESLSVAEWASVFWFADLHLDSLLSEVEERLEACTSSFFTLGLGAFSANSLSFYLETTHNEYLQSKSLELTKERY